MSIEQHTIKQAQGMRSGINVIGKVTSLEDRRTVNRKTGGSVDCRNVILTDPSGSITLVLWDSDIQKVKEGNEVEITNGYTSEYKGQISLTKGKFGQLKVI